MKRKAEIMRCPYRKEITRYTPFGSNEEQSLETFPECHKGSCPLYSYGKCYRVQAEIKQALTLVEGEADGRTIFDL